MRTLKPESGQVDKGKFCSRVREPLPRPDRLGRVCTTSTDLWRDVYSRRGPEQRSLTHLSENLNFLIRGAVR